jgi:D-allulose-6-phosphate 3-epimerase
MISPSLMCMDFLKIKDQIDFLNCVADFFHADIMDFKYVPNMALTPDFIRQIKPVCKLPIDAHLMVENMDMIDLVIHAGADYITLHADVIEKSAFRQIQRIRDSGVRPGVALNPAEPVEKILQYIALVDKITVMSVDPGFAGQKFIPEVLDKIRKLKKLKDKYSYRYLIEVDGACNQNTYRVLKDAGAEVFILGSSGLFSLDADVKVAWSKMLMYMEQNERTD